MSELGRKDEMNEFRNQLRRPAFRKLRCARQGGVTMVKLNQKTGLTQENTLMGLQTEVKMLKKTGHDKLKLILKFYACLVTF